jgi:hypothetical protein
VSEPTRKKMKASGVLVSTDQPSSDDKELSFRTQHPECSVLVDLTDFSVGTHGVKVKSGKWSGSFSGRPELINELFPHIKVAYSGLSVGTINGLKVALRTWWRLFDECEDVAPVRNVMDINEIHAALARKSKVEQGAHAKLLSLLNSFRRENGCVPLYWISYSNRKPQSDLPESWEVKAIHDTLKRRYFLTLDRWQAADKLAAEGFNWVGSLHNKPVLEPWKTQDIHATYRGVAEITGNPCPPKNLAISMLGLRYCKAFDKISIPVYGLYPSKKEVQAFFMLFLLRTGWNPQTALDIDVNSDFLEEHPVSPMFHVIRSVKRRAGTEQVAVGAKKSTLSPGNIVLQLVERTMPLRDALRRKLDRVEQQLKALPSSEELRQEQSRLRASVKSPWLFCVARIECKILSLASNTYHTEIGGGGFVRTLISEINEGREEERKINPSITSSDFRDAYIAFAYRNSGYSWLAAKIAAGHKSIESLKHYLRQRQWKEHSQSQVLHFTEKLWSEIQGRRVVDPAVLHALVQRGEVSEQQRLRWSEHKDRTRVGVGCVDFKNPPKIISPEHQAGSGCRVQRCTLCVNAVVFPDSLDHLARRQAELEFLRTNIPLVAWTESSFGDELVATEDVLKQFETSEVSARLAYWMHEISSGRHLVFGMEGAYA